LGAGGAIRRACADLVDVAGDLRALRAPQPRRYAFSALFLGQCLRELTADAREQLFFVTGPTVHGVHVPSQAVTFTHARRTVLGVTGDERSTPEALLRLEAAGQRLLAHFHSHPGAGAASTRPSGTDEAYQRRLERGGYPVVSGIFARDGHVRFWRLDGDVSVEVQGDGVELVEPGVYRLGAAHVAR
ncbi:Mov34/MPN/PAD-1 family protein, partial [Luteitalea sp.]|uniref:Mov34/MPN/PAD-1 family protein n=1 Tax=Luteitalea sp. TaxID=2004800 RepID=UPI0025C4F2C4